MSACTVHATCILVTAVVASDVRCISGDKMNNLEERKAEIDGLCSGESLSLSCIVSRGIQGV